MSLARLWRDQGKVQQARELLAPIYGDLALVTYDVTICEDGIIF